MVEKKITDNLQEAIHFDWISQEAIHFDWISRTSK